MMYALAVPCLLDALPCVDRALRGRTACATREDGRGLPSSRRSR
jgi:hypothetical protein